MVVWHLLSADHEGGKLRGHRLPLRHLRPQRAHPLRRRRLRPRGQRRRLPNPRLQRRALLLRLLRLRVQ
eukprot:4516207-Pyramimonas_sp.AAC.1